MKHARTPARDTRRPAGTPHPLLPRIAIRNPAR
jgi:hypothetical protein